MDDPIYSISVVADALSIHEGTLRARLTPQKQIFRLGETDKGATKGGTRLLTMRRVLQIGTAYSLIDLGMEPASAARAAMAFSDFGNTDPERAPGELFDRPADRCFTVLVAYPGIANGVVYRFDNTTPMRRLFFPEGADAGEAAMTARRLTSAYSVFLDPLVHDWTKKLKVTAVGDERP